MNSARLWGPLFLCVLAACQQGGEPITPQAPEKKEWQFLSAMSKRFPSDFSITQVMDWVSKGKIKSASLYVNGQLKRHIDNMALHLVNGLIYEELSRLGDADATHCVGAAYQAAHRCEPSSWVPLYFNGLYLLRQKNYKGALSQFLAADRIKPKKVEILYSLSRAAYYAQDLVTARRAMETLLDLSPKDARIYAAASILFAALGDFRLSKCLLETYRKKKGPEAVAKKIHSRVCQWQDIHRAYVCNKMLCKKPSLSSSGAACDASGGDSPLSPHEKEELNKRPLVFLDGYLLAFVTTKTSGQGNNILNAVDQNGAVNALALLMGGMISVEGLNPLSSLSGFSGVNVRSESNTTTTGVTKNSHTDAQYGFALGTPSSNPGGVAGGLTYSLNILNSGSKVLEISARPSVAALVGEEGTFSNTDRLNSVVGGSQVLIDAGVKVTFKPISIDDDGLITMEVNLTNSVLDPGFLISSNMAEQLLSIRKSKCFTTVKVYPGQTLLISGMTAETKVSSESGFPGLRKVPLMGLFFSQNSTIEDVRTIMYMVTVHLEGQKGVEHDHMKTSPLLGQPAIYEILRSLESSGQVVYMRPQDFPPLFEDAGCVPLAERIIQMQDLLLHR